MVCKVGIISAMEYIYFALAFFFAGVVPELTGFGVATVSMPLLSLVMPLSVVIPLVAIISMVATGIVALQKRTPGLYKRIAVLVFGSLLGVPVGMLFLNVVDEHLLSTIFGIFLVGYALYGLIAKEYLLPKNNVTGSLVGFFAGFFGASFNIHGPLVGLYSVSDDDTTKQQTRGLIAMYMFLSGVFTVVGHLLSGRVTTEVLWYALFSSPFLLLGLFSGRNMFRKLDASWIRRGIYLFVLSAGILILL